MIRSWLARRRDYRALIDGEATRLVAQEGGAGYYSAGAIARLARDRGDLETAKFWRRVARQVADRTGLQPGHSKIGRPEAEW
jgi:hypothetical protein